jgi:hypothetical protein
MKGKKTTYLLLIAVLAVWGTIIYRIIEHRKPDIVPEYTYSVNSGSEELFSDDDVYKLKLNYTDPFLKGNYSTTSQSKETAKAVNNQNNFRRRVLPQNSSVINEKVNWPEIKYSGLIINNNSSSQIGLLVIDNESFIMQSGDEQKEVKLEKLYPDSVSVKFGEELKTIVKE